MQFNRNYEGNYVCRAKKSEGTVVSSAKIDVLGQYLHNTVFGFIVVYNYS